jgi:predicted MFS family arabinose efflux permease
VANALLCDVFPPEDKARTVSVFNIGLFLGGAAGFAFGAVLGFPLGLIVTAVPGLALALLVAGMDVPPRAVTAVRPASWRTFARDAASIYKIPTMRWMLLGAVFASFAAGGFLGWFVDFVAATKGLSIEAATAVFGGSALTGGLAGVITGGVVGDRLRRRLEFGRLAAISIGFLGAVPCAVASIFIDSGFVFYAASWLLLFFVSWYHGPMAAVVDDLVPAERAATSQAGFIFTMHFFGTAPASFLVGLAADHVGLRLALLLPAAAVLLSALSFMGGWRTVGADCAVAAAT